MKQYWSETRQQPWNLFNKLTGPVVFGMFLLIVSLEVIEPHFLVKTLPGFDGDLPFTLETGYIEVGDSELFYYFVESERDPKSDPLMLLLTGGPGCSGFTFLCSQSGPFDINYEDSTSEKPIFEKTSYGWTKVSNIIYIDQPAGSGFSYAKTAEAYKTNDNLAATETYQFLKKWLVDHPKFLNNPLYIASSSYGGIVVPVIVNEIYKGNEVGEEPKINIKGYVLGNPLTDILGDRNSQIPYAHRMALLSDAIYKSALQNCHGEYWNVDPNNTPCMRDLEVVQKCLQRINTEQILDPQCDTSNTLKSNLFRRVLRSFNNSSRDSWSLPQSDTQTCEGSGGDAIPAWANRKDVREALHISKEFDGIEWERCNDTLTLENTRKDGVSSYWHNIQSSVVHHKHLVNKNARALIYSGDHDMHVPYLGTLRWIESLNLIVSSDWRPWFVDEQVAGYTMLYSNKDYNLTFSTIKGGGHVPLEYKPKEYLSMIARWLASDAL